MLPEEVSFVVPFLPIGAPRMTKADVWKKRPIVIQYRHWCDEIRRAATGSTEGRLPTPDGIKVLFVLPMPESLRDSQKEKLYGLPHDRRPDADNLLKGVMDALFEKDSGIWSIQAEKYFVGRSQHPHAVITLIGHSFPGGTVLCDDGPPVQ